MNEASTALIIFFGTVSSICLCCIITVKCKLTKKLNDRAEKIRKRFVSVHIEDVNIETTIDEIMFDETKNCDIESNYEEIRNSIQV